MRPRDVPEGDTIHKLAARLRLDLEGRALIDARLGGQRLGEFIGREVQGVSAVGKHLFVLVGTRALRTHLGMSGAWLRCRPGGSWPGRSWQLSALLATEDVVLRCVRAKEADVLDVRGQRFRAWMRRLGPDLGGESVDLGVIVRRARELLPETSPLVDVLLDQRVAAGIGNVYKSETLFLTGMSPVLPLSAIDDEDLARLFGRARDLLRGNLRPGPRRTRAPRPSPSSLRDSDDPALWVYCRTGEPCFLCRAPIGYARLGRNSRATWWCERCQGSTRAAGPSLAPSSPTTGSRSGTGRRP